MFAVVWQHTALDALADLYVSLDLSDQQRVVTGIEELNRRLARDPLTEGESRAGGYRVTFPDLLMVHFWVSESEGVVQVVDVRRYGR